MHLILPCKKAAQNVGLFLIFKKLPEGNNSPIGENLSNLVTLHDPCLTSEHIEKSRWNHRNLSTVPKTHNIDTLGRHQIAHVKHSKQGFDIFPEETFFSDRLYTVDAGGYGQANLIA
jgi:hypothetical protein